MAYTARRSKVRSKQIKNRSQWWLLPLSLQGTQYLLVWDTFITGKHVKILFERWQDRFQWWDMTLMSNPLPMLIEDIMKLANYYGWSQIRKTYKLFIFTFTVVPYNGQADIGVIYWNFAVSLCIKLMPCEPHIQGQRTETGCPWHNPFMLVKTLPVINWQGELARAFAWDKWELLFFDKSNLLRKYLLKILMEDPVNSYVLMFCHVQETTS